MAPNCNGPRPPTHPRIEVPVDDLIVYPPRVLHVRKHGLPREGELVEPLEELVLLSKTVIGVLRCVLAVRSAGLGMIRVRLRGPWSVVDIDVDVVVVVGTPLTVCVSIIPGHSTSPFPRTTTSTPPSRITPLRAATSWISLPSTPRSSHSMIPSVSDTQRSAFGSTSSWVRESEWMSVP
jgi:hypothetical protein